MSLNNKMGRKHEDDLVDILGGYRTVASGSTWRDQMDGRLNRDRVPFAFAWDGKSTLGKSVGVSREMWRKAVQQACAERPMLALRFYGNERLDVDLDLVVVNLHDFAEMLEEINRQKPPTRIFCVMKEGSEREIKMPPPPLVIYPDGTLHRAQSVNVAMGLEKPPEIEIDGRKLTFQDGKVEVYVNNVVRYDVWPGVMQTARVEL